MRCSRTLALALLLAATLAAVASAHNFLRSVVVVARHRIDRGVIDGCARTAPPHDVRGVEALVEVVIG